MSNIEIVISVATIVLANVTALLTARFTAHHEMKKMRLEWQREDKKELHNAFADMVRNVSVYCNQGGGINRKNAVGSVALLQTMIQDEKMTKLLTTLGFAIQESDRQLAKKYLADVQQKFQQFGKTQNKRESKKNR